MDAPNSETILLDASFAGRSVSVGAQTVLFHNDVKSIDRSLAAMARAASLARAAGVCTEVAIHYGDSSPIPCLSERHLAEFRRRYGGDLRIEYQFFDANLGSAGGQNRLAESNSGEIIFLMNPDVVVSPRLFEVMLGEFTKPQTGIVEAKQLPIEHPKDYDAQTGDTSWASGACSLMPATLFRRLGGYDADSFFLYGDDVDLSWRARLAGFRVVFQPAALVFHDKRLNAEGGWLPSEAERYYSVEAALLLPYKWSRADLTDLCLKNVVRAGETHGLRAAAEFERRKAENRLPLQIDADHRVGQFIDGEYAKHRFSL
jgi:GT2 family glycosyltransferase